MQRGRRIALLIAALMVGTAARAYDFSVSTGSNTLYYTVVSSTTVMVVDPGWGTYAKPTGQVVVPATVTNGGTTYGVVAIDRQAFRLCTAMTSISLPEGLRVIGGLAFMGCSSLTAVTLPSTLDSIAVEAFNGTGLVSDISNWDDGGRALYIGQYLIKVNNSTSDTLTIRAGTKGIAGMALDYCRHLDSVSLPATLRFIGPRAFADCDSLRVLRMQGTQPPRMAGDSFEHVEGMRLMVPCEAVATYDAEPHWHALAPEGADCPEDTGGNVVPHPIPITDSTIVPLPWPLPVVGIDVQPEATPTVVARAGQRVEVSNATGRAVAICDVAGRVVAEGRAGEERFVVRVPAAGVYIVAIEGTRPRRVVVGR